MFIRIIVEIFRPVYLNVQLTTFSVIADLLLT